MGHSCTPQLLSLVDKDGKIAEQIEMDGLNVALMGESFIILRRAKGLYLYEL